ncbi:glycoside hydrolase family 25 protein [Pseudoroseicyclus aestuarii]|uniref:Lysozyme n=1 Tax=Pseudoroseicyclus aestuarii TaxID=1795041 RepID=A0A318SVD9_9RHOB|nr:GH25 family lysozyme [Pseudoroseicyclus aestuarii]PYE85573.1 lysozyme [Pseudoroseicyclus aestuarii]
MKTLTRRAALAGGAAAALGTLASCGVTGGAQAPGQVVSTRPDFGDAAPHPWSGRRPSDHPVHGIDVARYQDPLDWRRAQQAGVSFAFIKATEGADNVDAAFREHWNGAGAAGVPRGAYHFYYFCAPAADQARNFIRMVPRIPGDLPPVLDLEWNPFSPTCTWRPPAATVRSEVQIWLDMVERHFGQSPVIYTAIDFWETNELWRLGDYDFWLRSVAADPSERYANARWVFWQYSSTGLVPGARGEIDLNAFAGSRAEWARWLAARRI